MPKVQPAVWPISLITRFRDASIENKPQVIRGGRRGSIVWVNVKQTVWIDDAEFSGELIHLLVEPNFSGAIIMGSIVQLMGVNYDRMKMQRLDAVYSVEEQINYSSIGWQLRCGYFGPLQFPARQLWMPCAGQCVLKQLPRLHVHNNTAKS